MLELSKFKFFCGAIWADFKQSRGWKVLTISYALLGLVFLVMRFVTTWTPAQLLASWSGKAKVIFLLSFLLIGLILLLIAVVDGARRIHLQAVAPLNETIENQRWLVEIAEQDRRDLGKGVVITECEVRLDLECRSPYAEFTFAYFNGLVFPMSVEMELDGFISFGDGRNTHKLTDKPEKLRSKSFIDKGQRHARGEFTVKQNLNPSDVAFISADTSRNGFFIFDDLVVMVRGYGEALEDIQPARLPIVAFYVRPKLQWALREDASALESKRRAYLSRIHNLGIVRGMALQLWEQLRVGDEPHSKDTLDKWEMNALTHLTHSYGKDGAEGVYKDLSHGDPIPAGFAPSQRQWFESFFVQIEYLISREKEEV